MKAKFEILLENWILWKTNCKWMQSWNGTADAPSVQFQFENAKSGFENAKWGWAPKLVLFTSPPAPPYFERQTHLKRGFQHTEQLFTLPEHLWSKQGTFEGKNYLRMKGVSGSYKWKAWGLWDLPCPIIHIHDKLSAACIICPCVERFRVEYVNVEPR